LSLDQCDTMKTNFSKQFLLAVTGLCLVSTTVRAEIRVGLSEVDITPPIGGLTTGYSSAEPTDGVHDPVSARVMVLESDQQCVALVVCDLCVYNSAWLHHQMAAIGVDRLLLLNTHTHAGPKLSQGDFPSPETPWRDTVDQRLLDAIKEAQQGMFKGFFAASESQIQLGYNRLVHRGDFSVTHFENPERIPYGSVDRQVGVITLPGEPFHHFQVDFRNRSNVEHSFLFGYCCNGPYDWPRYLPDLLSAARGGYGASDTTVAEVGAGERLVNEGLIQLFTLQGRLKPAPQRHTFDRDSPQ
jgi:hypothetical protein